MQKNIVPYAPVEELDQPDQSIDVDTKLSTPTDSVSGTCNSCDEKKENKGYLKKTLITLTFFTFAHALFIICNQKCPYDDATTCARNFIYPNLARWAAQIIIASIIFVTIIYQAAYGRISRFFILGTVTDIIYLGIYYHPILSAKDYGQMFGYFLIVCCGSLSLILGIVVSIRACLRKNPLYTTIGIPLSFVIFCIVFYFTRVQHSCDHWNQGIGNEVIINDGNTCQVRTPPVCVYEVTSGWFDISKLTNSCSKFKADSDILEQYYPDSPIVGFPRTEKFTQKQRLPIQKAVLESMIPLSSINDPAAQDLEIFLDKSTSHPKYHINVKRNQELVNERSKIQSESLVKNVLVIYIDALSRANALRKLPKTMKWFDSFTNNKNPSADAFQFFKYHSIAPYTYPNLYEALYGKHPQDPTLSKAKPIESFVKQYQEKGFITGHATDFCQTSPLDIATDEPILDTPYDHEGISLACDPHYHDPISPYKVLQGPYSSVRRCLYGKDVYEHVYDYGNQFWRSYKDEKKILYLDFLNAHEGTNEVVKYMDNDLSSFLNNLQKDGLLEDTAVVLYADHGLHMNGIFTLLDINQVHSEIFLPSLFTVLPKKVTEKFGNNIKANEQTLVSAHELHNFFFSLAEGEKSNKLEKSLLGPLAPGTSCSDIGVMEGRCACKFY